MASPPPSNAKIYDRPPRKGPSPLLLVLVVIVLLVIGYFVYKALHHPATPVAARASFAPSYQPVYTFYTFAPARSGDRLPETGSRCGLPVSLLSPVSATAQFTIKETHYENHRWIV
jgi:hypothetical protein